MTTFNSHSSMALVRFPLSPPLDLPLLLDDPLLGPSSSPLRLSRRSTSRWPIRCLRLLASLLRVIVLAIFLGLGWASVTADLMSYHGLLRNDFAAIQTAGKLFPLSRELRSRMYVR